MTIDVAARGADWHAIRAKHVGGSEIAALFGLAETPDYARSHYALWMVKAGRVPAPVVDNPRTRWGLRYEEATAHGAAEDNGWQIAKAGYVTDPTTPGLGCTPDYIIAAHDHPERRGPGVLECKQADWLVHRKTWTDGEPPLHILLQLQHQLAATGFSWGAVACIVGGNDLRIYAYDARPRLIADIRAKVRAFWQSIADDRPPQVDGSDSAAAVLRALYPETVDEIADLKADNELPTLCAAYLAAGAKRRAADADESEARNQIVAKIGIHRAAMVHGYTIRVGVTPEKAPTSPPAGYLIPGRKEVRRMTVKEFMK